MSSARVVSWHESARAKGEMQPPTVEGFEAIGPSPGPGCRKWFDRNVFSLRASKDLAFISLLLQSLASGDDDSQISLATRRITQFLKDNKSVFNIVSVRLRSLVTTAAGHGRPALAKSPWAKLLRVSEATATEDEEVQQLQHAVSSLPPRNLPTDFPAKKGIIIDWVRDFHEEFDNFKKVVVKYWDSPAADNAKELGKSIAAQLHEVREEALVSHGHEAF